MAGSTGAGVNAGRRISFLLFALLAGAAQGQQLLHDNGPIRTGIGDGAGGADTSAVQVAAGQTITGYGAGWSGGHRLADDFVVPSPGWRLQHLRMPAFQRGADPSGTPLSAMTVRIWDGPPDSPGSNVVFGDVGTNRLVQSGFAGIYRVTGARLVDDSAPLFDAVAGNLAAVLPPGTYWLDWQLQGTRASGPLVPPVTRAGQAGSGNALQFLGDGWYPIAGVGGAGQELPFVLTGTVLEFEGQLFSDGFEDAP